MSTAVGRSTRKDLLSGRSRVRVAVGAHVICAGQAICHQKQALADLLSALEWRADADITGSTVDEIAAAQAEIAKDMGW
jgi:hypothetical protein